jgi:hypothetical protein
MSSLAWLLWCLVGIVWCSPISTFATTNITTPKPIPPSKDPWYTAPGGYENVKPGTVLKVRVAPGDVAKQVSASAAWNILYRTTDSQYKPTWAVTTLFAPPNPSAGRSSLLSYQFPYDCVNIDGSPSYSLYTTPPSSMAIDRLLYTAIMLGGGWFLNVPDYEGPKASLGAGVMSGHATIDSIRAVLSEADRFGLAKDAKYAMWGYSGGALATEWAGELQVQYAPEMVFAGAVIGGLTPNLTSVLTTISKTQNAGLAVAAILGLTTQFPDASVELEASLKTSGPYNANKFLSAFNLTHLDLVKSRFKNDPISEYFIHGFDDIFNSKVLSRIIYSDGIMGFHGVPQMPLFVHNALYDEVSPIAATDKLVDEYCEMGANIYYRKNNATDHSGEGFSGLTTSIAWLRSVFDGTYATTFPTKGCRRSTGSTTEIVL